MSIELPLVEICGNPAERGEQYGHQVRELICRSVEIYREVMSARGCSWDEAMKLAKDFSPYIETHSQDLFEELRGIAKGADLPIEALVVINGRSELMFGRDWYYRNNGQYTKIGDECTSVLAMPEVTAAGNLLHGQNWDWRQDCLDSAIILRVIPEEGPTILTFVEAGGLARCGMNSAGIAITGNGLESSQDDNRLGIPLSLIRRDALSATNLHDAMQSIILSPRAVSNNMMLSSVEKGGAEAINFETAPEEVFFTHPTKGILTHANHFECPVARVKLRDTGIAFSTCSLFRSHRASRLLQQHSGHIVVDHLAEVLDDRFGTPRAICRSPVTARDGSTLTTVASIIMDPAAQKMWVRPSPYNNLSATVYSVVPGSLPEPSESTGILSRTPNAIYAKR